MVRNLCLTLATVLFGLGVAHAGDVFHVDKYGEHLDVSGDADVYVTNLLPGEYVEIRGSGAADSIRVHVTGGGSNSRVSVIADGGDDSITAISVFSKTVIDTVGQAGSDRVGVLLFLTWSQVIVYYDAADPASSPWTLKLSFGGSVKKTTNTFPAVAAN